MASPSAGDLLRAMDERATKGPWFVVGPPWNRGAPFINAQTEDPHGGHVVCDFSIQEENDDGGIEREPHAVEDSRLVVALRNALPALAAVLDAADALRESAGGEHTGDAPCFVDCDACVDVSAYDAALATLVKELEAAR